MNSLDRDLKNGDKVVISSRGDVNPAVRGKTFVCNGGGFGSVASCRGMAVFGTLDGEECRIEGCHIDAKATMDRYGFENGWVSVKELEMLKQAKRKFPKRALQLRQVGCDYELLVGKSGESFAVCELDDGKFDFEQRD